MNKIKKNNKKNDKKNNKKSNKRNSNGKNKKFEKFGNIGKNIISFTVPMIPLSVNIIYRKSRSGIVYKTGEAKEFVRKFNSYLGWIFDKYSFYDEHKKIFRMKDEFFIGLKEYKLSVIVYFESLYYKNKNVVKLDISNHIKILEDCIQDFFNYDDKYNFSVFAQKRECKYDPRVECILRAYTKKELSRIHCNCKLCRKSKVEAKQSKGAKIN